MKNKVQTILIDALILFTVSTFFVIAVDRLFALVGGHAVKTDPIVTAILQDDTKEVKKLVEADKQSEPNTENETANPDTALNPADLVDDHKRTALMRAAFVNNYSKEKTAKSDEQRAKMIPLLLDHGAPLEARDKDGWTALMWAAWSGLPKSTACLLERGASPSPAGNQGNTALMLAAGRANAQIVRMLLEHGADKNTKNNNGLTALDLAKTGITAYPDKKTEYLKVIKMLK